MMSHTHKIIKLISKSYLWKITQKVIFTFLTLLIFIFLITYLLTYLYPLPLKIVNIINSSNYPEQIDGYMQKYMLNLSPLHRSLILTWRTLTFNFGYISTVGDFEIATSDDSQIFNYWIKRNSVGYAINIISFFIALLVGVSLGYWAAKKRSSKSDYFINMFAILFLSVPAFVLIPIVNIARAQISGYLNISYQNSFWYLFNIDFDPDQKLSYFFPIIIMTLIIFAPIMQISRNTFIKVLTSDYYNFALCNGVSKTRIFFSYILKNSLDGILNLLPFLFVGVFINNIFLETFCNVPGTWKNLYALISWNENNACLALIYILSLTYSLSYILIEIVKYVISPYKGVVYE